MKQLFAITLLTLLSTGCTYKGVCETNGYESYPYNDDSHYSSVTCTKYCSNRFPEICSATPEAMMQAVEDKHLELDKNNCKNTGYKPETEALADCVMKMREKREAAKAAQAAQQAQALQEENMRRAAAAQAFSESMEQQSQNLKQQQQYYQQQQQQLQQQQYYRRTQAVTPAKSTDLNCLNQCTSAGYQYGLCQSKCSY